MKRPMSAAIAMATYGLSALKLVPSRSGLTALRFALCPRRGSRSRRGTVTRAAGEGPRDAGIDGQCESSHEADPRCNDSLRSYKEAEALRRSCAIAFRPHRNGKEKRAAPADLAFDVVLRRGRIRSAGPARCRIARSDGTDATSLRHFWRMTAALS